MEIVVERLVDKMLQEKMISTEDKKWYIYSLQLIIEKIVSYSTILLLAMIFGFFFQTIGFLLVFSVIRKYSGGFHFKHFWSCYLFSIGTYLAFVLVYQNYQFEFSIIPMIISSLACLGIFGIGAVNNRVYHWSMKEEREKCSLTRYSILVIYVVLAGLMLSGIDESYLWFMGWGLILSLISQILVKFIEISELRGE